MENPLKDKSLRLPGQSLDEKLTEFVDEKIGGFLVIIALALIFISLEWVRSYWIMPPHPILVTIAGSIAIIFCSFRIRKNVRTALAIRQGRDGERIVGQQLEGLRTTGCVIFHDILGKDFNIDHVVVSLQGIFTIETKTWSKRNPQEEIRFDGHSLIVNGHRPDRDSIIQSIAEANWLRRKLKESTGKEFQVNPVIVFPGWFVDPVSSKFAQEKGVWLLNPKALPKYIKNTPVILSNEDLNLATFHLTRYIQTT